MGIWIGRQGENAVDHYDYNPSVVEMATRRLPIVDKGGNPQLRVVPRGLKVVERKIERNHD